MAYVKTTWVNDETIVNAQRMNHIEDGIKNLESVSLLAVSDTAPSECVEGDLYYNTTTKKIYQAIDTDVWDSEGTDPLDKILYIVFSTKTTYSLDDNGDLISVGGGGDEISIGSTEPQEQEVLWINPEDAPSGSLNPITNEYSVATDKAYSCKYTNDLIDALKVVTFNGEWLDGIKSSGTGKVQLIVPIYNPEKKLPTLNFSQYNIYTGSAWVSGTNIECNGAGSTWVNLSITPPSSLTQNGVFLISLVGTITIS